MNIVKLQDSLKDLSDRQLMQTMQAGSAPQYLVLAEMQRRKKTRESAAQQQQGQKQPQTSVAEDIISGIAAVPTGPMQMAEGGLVSFAKGGSTGRAKGEEEACWTDSRTGEKYCPPNRPQTEMPRKRFQEGGMIPPDEMAEIEVARRLQELQATNPNATEYEAIQSLMREGSELIPAMYGTETAQAAPASPSPQPEPAAGDDEGFFSRMESGLTSFLRGIAPGSGSDMEGTGEFPPPSGSPTAESAAGLPFLRFRSEQVVPPIESVEEDQARRREQAEREQAEREQAEREQAEGEQDDQTNLFPDLPDTGGSDDDPLETPREDGLMELMRELQAEKRESREGLRDRAINEALIRGGLTMAASRDPNFLTAAAEGGIGGLAGYQGAMERAAERQGEITSEMSDLMIAREANDLRRQAENARAQGLLSEQMFDRVKILQGQLEDISQQLVENPAMDDEEKAELQTQRDRLRAALENAYKLAGIDLTEQGESTQGPANRGNVTFDGE